MADTTLQPIQTDTYDGQWDDLITDIGPKFQAAESLGLAVRLEYDPQATGSKWTITLLGRQEKRTRGPRTTSNASSEDSSNTAQVSGEPALAGVSG